MEHGETLALRLMRHGDLVIVSGCLAMRLLHREVRLECVLRGEDADRSVCRAVNFKPVDIHQLIVLAPLRLNLAHSVFIHLGRMLPDRRHNILHGTNPFCSTRRKSPCEEVILHSGKVPASANNPQNRSSSTPLQFSTSDQIHFFLILDM